MEVRSDNLPLKNSDDLSNLTGEGVVIDIGTGDGRFVSAAAKANPNKFFIGIDANVKPLEKRSMKATRKPSKGGLPNVLFVQASVEDLPAELANSADEIHIHFPWGSLLKTVATGDESILRSLRQVAVEGCLLEIVIGLDPERDHAEIERLNISSISPEFIQDELASRYSEAGFELVEYRMLSNEEWSTIETSWARRLSVNEKRIVVLLVFEAV